MRSGPLSLNGLLLAGFLLACMLLPCLATAEPALVQTTGSQGFVRALKPVPFDPQKLRFIFADAVLIHVLVTNPADGAPITNLGDSVGGWDSIISLPQGWTLQSLAGPAFCGWFAPTRFENHGNGIYRIYVTYQFSLFCPGWRAGDYVYRVEIDNPNGTTFRGSGMGLFEIKGP